MLNEKRDRIMTIENRYNIVIKIEAQSNLISPEYSLEKVKGHSTLPNSNSSIKIDNQIIKGDETDKQTTQVEITTNPSDDETSLDETQGKRRRRRRRKPKPRPTNSINENELRNNINIDDTSEIISSRQESEMLGTEPIDNGSNDKIKKGKGTRLSSSKTRKNSLKTNQTPNAATSLDEDSKLNAKGKPNSIKKAATKKVLPPKEALALEKKDDKVATINSKSNSNEDKALGEAASKKRGWWNKTKT
jgi:ribonuclease E